jgi:hypothetical protein
VVQGAVNPNSKTNALNIFKQKIADHHLNNEKTYEIWLSKLRNVFEN